MSDYIDRVVGERWHIFGEHADGCVDLSDGQNDVFEHVSRDKAQRLMKLRDDFLAAVRAEYAGEPEAQPTYQADLELAPDWNLTYERMVTHADGLQDALEQDTQRLQKLGVKCVLITLTVVELKQ